MGLTIPEIVQELHGLPEDSRREVLEQITAKFGAFPELPEKEELSPYEKQATQEADQKAQKRAENEKKFAEENRKLAVKSATDRIIGSLNTLGSDDVKIAMNAIAGNIQVPPSNIPTNETPEELSALPKTELLRRAEAEGIGGRREMNEKELVAAIVKVQEGKRPASGNVQGEGAKGAAESSTGEDLTSLTKTELLDRAREQQIAGASGMNKDELVDALKSAKK